MPPDNTVNQQQYGGGRFGDTAQVTGLIAGGDVTNSGVLNIYALHVTETQARVLQQALQDVAAIPPCPYPGLLPFRPQDARFFYGREKEIQTLVLRLRQERLLLVIGPS